MVQLLHLTYKPCIVTPSSHVSHAMLFLWIHAANVLLLPHKPCIANACCCLVSDLTQMFYSSHAVPVDEPVFIDTFLFSSFDVNIPRSFLMVVNARYMLIMAVIPCGLGDLNDWLTS